MVSKDDLAFYEDREHAAAKHELLKSYIQRYTMILGRSETARLAFVDGFAGPWQSGSDDFSDTSFGIEVKTLRQCAETLLETFHFQPEVRALWIEAEDCAFVRLASAAARLTNSKVSISAEHGQFEHKIQNVLDFIGPDAHAFIFVDPKGYAGLIEPGLLAPLLRRPRTELLINYMWDHIRYAYGHLGNEKHADNMRRLHGDHLDALSQMSDPKEREIQSAVAYENELRAIDSTAGKNRLRVLSYPILDTRGGRHTKYYLVHVTHAAKGLVTFAEECDKNQLLQDQIFQLAQQSRRERRSGIEDIFGDVPIVPKVAAPPAAAPWLDVLPMVGDEIVVDTEVWSQLLERGRCLPSALLEGARQLIEEGVLINLSIKRPRRTRHVDYEKGDRVRRLR